MTTNPTALMFVSNAGNPGVPQGSRTLGDHIGEYVYNVKSFGAHGDNGIHNDRVAIQACLDAAFQDTDITRYWSYSTLPAGELYTRLVYFPAGIYVIDAPLLMPSFVHGGMIFGDGMGVSVISNTTSGSDVIHTNGLLNHTIRDMSLWSAGGSGSACYHWDNDVYTAGTSGLSKELCWINVEFKGGEAGIAAGLAGQCDVTLVMNCYFHNHSRSGIWCRNANLLNWVIQGGKFESCNVGIEIANGSIPTIQGVQFSNNTLNDIQNFHSYPLIVIGCYSESNTSNGFVASNGMTKLIGCIHTGTGYFLNIAFNAMTPVGTTAACIDACVSDVGTFIEGGGGGGASKIYARGCKFAANAFTAVPYGGTVMENI